MEKRIHLLNLHADDMLGGTFDRVKYRIRIQNDPVSLNMPPAMLGCCKSEEKATPVPSCVSGSDVCSACEESSLLLHTGKTSAGGHCVRSQMPHFRKNLDQLEENN